MPSGASCHRFALKRLVFKLFIANKNYSSWSLRPWVLMRELRIPFEEKLVPFGGKDDPNAFRTFSPTGKFPCLVDGVAVVWDSLAITEYLAECPEGSRDRYILLDAQDWMTDAQLGALWTEITRTARPGARVIFRTAAEPSLLPGRLAPELLARWRYEEALSRDLTQRDRSAIYGGFHLYVLEG